MYYKNQWTASCPDLKPLMAVPVHEIVAIFRVNLDLPENRASLRKSKDFSSIQTKYKEVFQFEVFTEHSEYPYKDEVYEDEFELNQEEEKVTKPDADAIDHLDGFKLWDEYQQRKMRESPENAKKKVVVAC